MSRKPGRSGGLGAVVAFCMIALLLMLPLYTESYKRYPALGSLWLPIAGLALVFAAASLSAAFVANAGFKGSRKSIMTASVTSLLLSVAGASMWAPVINGVLDFGATQSIEGSIEIIANPARRAPSRRVTAEIDGEERTIEFYPHGGFWDVAVVRNGGAATLTVGKGFFGVPWIRELEDAAPTR